MENIVAGWKYIDWDFETDKDDIYRYHLLAEKEKTINCSQDMLITFLMNPSYAGIGKSSTNSDSTINLLLNTIGSHYKYLMVINAIPLVEANSKKLNSKICQNDRLIYNKFHIERYIKDCLLFAPSIAVFVGVGAKINHLGSKVSENYFEIMKFLNSLKTVNDFFVIGLNKGDVTAQHPSIRIGNEKQQQLLNKPKRVQWDEKQHKFYSVLKN